MTLVCFEARSEKIPVAQNDSMRFYIRVDTLNNASSEYEFAGYLRMAANNTRLTVDRSYRRDSAVWRFMETATPFRYKLFNTTYGDTIRLRLPDAATDDTIASIETLGALITEWDSLDFKYDTLYTLLTRIDGYDTLQLTISDLDTVYISDTASHLYPTLYFSIERVVELPDTSQYLIFAVDTLMPDTLNNPFYLTADTLTRPDSLTVKDRLHFGEDLSLWKLQVDTIVHDTAFFKIRNKATDSLLVFEIPASDTVAYIENSGALNHWRMPFFVENKGLGQFQVRDTLTGVDYFLARKDNSVMLVTDTATYKPLNFRIMTAPVFVPDSSIVDSTLVYKVKYLNGPDSGKYLGADLNGDTLLLDTVYANIPDGQFVVNVDSKYSLISRVSYIWTDTIRVVYDTVAPYDTVEYQYTNGTDTFEIKPVDNVGANAYLGYKTFAEGDMAKYTYSFVYTSADSLNGRILGYNSADSLVQLVTDTVRFVLKYEGEYTYGAPAIGNIPQLMRRYYSIRPFEDSTLYMTESASTFASTDYKQVVMSELTPSSSYLLKADTVADSYYFVEFNVAIGGKLMADSTTKQIYVAPADTAVNHLFTIKTAIKIIPEPDPYSYLTSLPNGAGMYELAFFDVSRNTVLWLTRNYYDLAVLRKEGESVTLRSGSFEPADLQLWVDTARGPSYNASKPSFYIVNSVDTTRNVHRPRVNIGGYFLHVMDSMSLADHSEYVVTVGGKEYNCLNFVRAIRDTVPNSLLLDPAAIGVPYTARDSVGYPGKNEAAISEYRFYLQEVTAGSTDYYVVTEDGYGGEPGKRGYLSISPIYRKLYVGPRDDEGVCKFSFKSGPVANEPVLPPRVEDVAPELTVVGEQGAISFNNAKGEHVSVYNIVGQRLADKILTSDRESLSVSRGIAIVKVGNKTMKVVVR
jgi:hypothetical protein